MKAPPGKDLKEYGGAWHVRINDQWRLPFHSRVDQARSGSAFLPITLNPHMV